MRTVLFIFALLLRVAAIEATGGETIAFGDATDYVRHAQSLCSDGNYPERGNLPFFRAPGLPFFIAAVTACHPEQTRLVKYALAVCDAVTAVLIFMLATLLWSGGPQPAGRVQFQTGGLNTAAPLAAALAAVHPFFIGSVTDIRTEPLFMMLLVGAMVALYRRLPAGRTAGFQPALSGMLLGLAALTRPTALLCIPLFALYVASRREDGSGTRAGWKPAVPLIIAATLTLSPWIARNYLRFGELIVVNDAGGFNLWRGTHPELMRVVETHDRARFAHASWVFESQTVSAAAAQVESRASTPAARSREWQRMALENVRRDPWLALQSTLKKAALYWRPWLHPAEHSLTMIALSVLVILALYTFGGIGLFLHPLRVPVLLFFAAMWLAHVAYFPSIRLRAPLTDPLLIAFAGAPLAMLTVRMRKYLPLALVVVPVIVIAVAATYAGSLPAVRAFITTLQAAAGEWWAAPLFIVAYVVFTIFLLPVGLLSATGALMWGWKVGGSLELLAATLGSIVPFLLARRGLGAWLERRIRRDDLPALDTPFTLLLLRIVPIVPYVALNYIAGTTRIRLRDNVLMTFFGSIPSVFLFAFFVDTMAASATGAATQAKIFAACAAVAAMAIIGKLVANRVARRG
jgi:uncharacterized membrane protein YdjX (TVP38/TMEM64 family)